METLQDGDSDSTSEDSESTISGPMWSPGSGRSTSEFQCGLQGLEGPPLRSNVVSRVWKVHLCMNNARVVNAMKILNDHEMQMAEKVLLKHIPRSLKVHGVLIMNRTKITPVEVIVDTWPDFNVIICRPDPKNLLKVKFGKTVSYYSTDEQILRRMLSEENTVDWSSNFDINGFDCLNAPMLKQLSSDRGVHCRSVGVGRLLYLLDSVSLISPAVHSELESRISPLDVSHADLVSRTWVFGGDEQSVRYVQHLIRNLPSCCITDDQGQPVSWVLVYDTGDLGFLYTLPEHRRKGYAKVLVSSVAQRCLAQGCPVYAYVEEDNTASYRLFKNLGFSDDPSYRAGWFQFNF